jgi:PAS domain S-box-containing protein
MDELLHHASFMPHGMCYLWQPDLLFLHVVSDAFIALAYFTIPFGLLWFVRKRKDLQFNWMFVCFAIFIVACGATHVMEIITVWNPVYYASGTVKAITAAASVPTAILLIKLLPDALRIPSPAALEREIEFRERAEQALRQANEQLEARVIERTALLESANRELRKEARLRKQVEQNENSSRQLLQGIADSAAAVIYAKDAEGRYLFTSRCFDLLLGLKPGEILGGKDEVLFPAETVAFLREVDGRAMASDTAITEDEVIPLAEGPHTYLTVKAPLRDSDNKPYGVFGISVDITERTRLDEQRRLHLERLALLEHATLAIGECTDLPSIYQAALRSLEESFGVDLAVICERGTENRFMSVEAIGTRSQLLADRLALTEQATIAFNQDVFERCLDGHTVYESNLSNSIARFPERLVRVNLRSLVSAPLIIDGHVVGSLLCARSAENAFTENDREFLTMLARHLSLAVNHARRYDSLRRQLNDHPGGIRTLA